MSVAVVCVETGNYEGRGDRYVRTLKAMVRKNLTVKHSFYCITDEHKDGITCIHAPDLKGWWGKIYQFRKGLFDEDLIIYFDLDTFILQSINGLAAFDGNFAMLRDFWEPRIAASGVMIWKNVSSNWTIWDRYEAEGFPQNHPNGDGGWLGDSCSGDILQKVFPGMFVSYKTECLEAQPKRAAVVCFHGHPRPHEAKGWAKDVWNRMKPAESIQMLPANV